MTSDDPVPIDPKDPEWKAFEKDVANFTANLPDPSPVTTYDARLPGELSQVPRQLDALVEASIGGATINVIIECKKYGKPVDVQVIDAFVGKLIDVGAESGVFYVFDSVTPAARSRAENARHPRVELREYASAMLGFATVWTEDLVDDLIGWDCPNENCYTGSISWQDFPQADSEYVPLAGYCDSCGTLAIRCAECEEIEFVHGGEYTCMGCGAVYEVELEWKSQELEGVRLVRVGE